MRISMPGSNYALRKPSANCQTPGNPPIRFGAEKTSKTTLTNDIFHFTDNAEQNQPPVPPQAEGLNRELLQAVKTNHPEEVRQHLGAGADPNARDRLFYTALHRAVDQGSIQTVDLLLEAGADPNAKAPLFQAPPLHKDPTSDQAQQIHHLGGDASTMNPIVQDTPLDRALHHNKPGVIPALILAGAECPKSLQPKVQNALKSALQTSDLTERLEQAISELDRKTATVLLRAGVDSKKLPYLYGDLLETAIDTAKATGPESQEARTKRHHQHYKSLQMIRLLTPAVPDYSYLAHIIAQNQDVILPYPASIPQETPPQNNKD